MLFGETMCKLGKGHLSSFGKKKYKKYVGCMLVVKLGKVWEKWKFRLKSVKIPNTVPLERALPDENHKTQIVEPKIQF